ncbi:hypothetical protein [Microtetraspora malaysiensis]|uniref:Uncharacterized protein n=1 Tax=Microtetraspora malaysiensis TaxID=161358 RepID=A0ABW6SMU5_9ACTN
MGPLGCAGEYTVEIRDRAGAVAYGTVEPSAVEWSRLLDDTSDATVHVPYSGPECCDLLNRTRTWCNSVSIFRDDELVWMGPITGLTYKHDETIITARDVTQWLVRRVIKTTLDFTGSKAADLAKIGEALVRHGYEQDDPGVLPYLHVVSSGIVGERKYDPDSGYVFDQLKELARTGVDWTAIGQRIIIAGEMPIARLPGLTDEHFVGELTVVEDGLAAATAATVLGKGVTAYAGGAGACGLLEVLVSEQEIMDVASARAEAEAIVAAGSPSPIYLDVPDDAQLDPDTPAAINDLVPGVLVPVASEETCRKVAAELRLQRVRVSFTEDAGEQVRVTLAPTGVQAMV